MGPVPGGALASNFFGDTMPQGQAGPLGLLIVVLLGVGLWVLIRSMNKRFRGMQTKWDPEAAERKHLGLPEPPTAEQTGGVTTDADQARTSGDGATPGSADPRS